MNTHMGTRLGPSALPERIQFRWVSSYQGCTHFEVSGDGTPYRVVLRWQASAYERSKFNGNDDEWQVEVVATVGLLRRAHDTHKPMSFQVVSAFNAWRAAEHARLVREIREQPERYGLLSHDDPLLIPPPPVSGAHYEGARGWIIDVEASTSQLPGTAVESDCAPGRS